MEPDFTNGLVFVGFLVALAHHRIGGAALVLMAAFPFVPSVLVNGMETAFFHFRDNVVYVLKIIGGFGIAGWLLGAFFGPIPISDSSSRKRINVLEREVQHLGKAGRAQRLRELEAEIRALRQAEH